MPLFGSKTKNNDQKASQPQGYGAQYNAPAGAPPGAYGAQYGAQYGVVGQPPTNLGYPAHHPTAPPRYTNEPPPPYSPPGVAQPQQASYPTPPGGYAPAAPPYVQQQQTVFVPHGLDAGARFGPMSSQSVPPPPPGCAPNAAQVAAMQGHNVVMTQQPSNFWTGGSGGGYTFW